MKMSRKDFLRASATIAGTALVTGLPGGAVVSAEHSSSKRLQGAGERKTLIKGAAILTGYAK